MMITAHERFLSGKPGGKRASLRFLDLTRLDLAGRNLTDADLSASILDGARMIRTNLERANLFGCDLRKADLRGANLKRADVRGCCLRGANLTMADLTQADFREGQIATPHPTKGLSMLSHQDRAGDADGALFVGATLDGSKFNGSSAFAAVLAEGPVLAAVLAAAVPTVLVASPPPPPLASVSSRADGTDEASRAR